MNKAHRRPGVRFPLQPLACWWVQLLLGAASAAAQPLKVGDEFPNFKATDAVTGQAIELEKLRGKVVLVDFWATWCGPCKGEIPNIKAAYEQYHKRGFEIISISLDNDVNVCKKYIKDNKLDWHHIADGKGWKADLAQKHKVSGIPQAIVVGRDGKIIDTHARGPALATAVERGLKQPAPKGTSSEPAAELLGRADQLRDTQHYLEALRLYEQVTAQDDDAAAAGQARGRIEALRSDPAIAQALADAEAAERRQKTAAEAESWMKLARQAASLGRAEMARKYYQRVIDAAPESELAHTAQVELAKLGM